MKITVELDCTPAEARQFLGLPDVTEANAAYVDAMTRAMQGVSDLDQLKSYAKQLAPVGQIGLKLFQQFLEGSAGAGAGGGGSPKKPSE